MDNIKMHKEYATVVILKGQDDYLFKCPGCHCNVNLGIIKGFSRAKCPTCGFMVKLPKVEIED
jgi:uncharacterized paraquat-inducible protein A